MSLVTIIYELFIGKLHIVPLHCFVTIGWSFSDRRWYISWACLRVSFIPWLAKLEAVKIHFPHKGRERKLNRQVG